MPRRRLINGVLRGFLGNVVSRYSEFQGHWLLGFLARECMSLEIDLLRCIPRVGYSPEERFVELASRKFNEQVGKWQIPPSWVTAARLDVTWSKELTKGLVNGRFGLAARDGYEATFAASVQTDLGRTLAHAMHVFVSPHDASTEMASARAV